MKHFIKCFNRLFSLFTSSDGGSIAASACAAPWHGKPMVGYQWLYAWFATMMPPPTRYRLPVVITGCCRST